MGLKDPESTVPSDVIPGLSWLVEECDVISPSNPNLCQRLGIQITGTIRNPTWSRLSFWEWLECQLCGRRFFKLYRPKDSQWFGCRTCHNLTYRSVQKHDARLDLLLKMSDAALQTITENGSDAWKRLALRARQMKQRVLQSSEKA